MSATQLIVQLKSLPASEREAFTRLFREMETATVPAEGEWQWRVRLQQLAGFCRETKAHLRGQDGCRERDRHFGCARRMVMNAYFDTAIILKLYVQEATSPRCHSPCQRVPDPYLLTPWQEIEARTALRLKAFRKEITAAEMRASLNALDEDILAGRWKTPEYKMRRLEICPRLSDRHAAKIGCRTLDLVHIAVALSLGVETFVTFDERQRAVAKLEGLTVKP